MRKSIVMLLAAGLLVGLAGTASAATASLGQSWPATTDVSRSPNWHVYVFVKGGVQYVQINDRNGTVHGAVALGGGAFLVLPMGVDAERFRTPGNAARLAVTDGVPSAPAETIYQDGATTITATTLTSGATLLNATSTPNCQADPAECSTKFN